jgi:hypothetical protein
MSFMSSFSGSSSSRAGYAPRRGRGRGGRIPFTKGREQIKPDIEKHPLGELLKTFHSSDLGVEQSGFARHATISDCQYVASYNWLNDRTIIVPGKLSFILEVGGLCDTLRITDRMLLSRSGNYTSGHC